MKASSKVNEDGLANVPANFAGGGGVEGIGVGLKGEPGVKPRKKLRDVVMTKTPLKRIVPGSK